MLKTAKASRLIDVPRSTLFSLLTDYDSYQVWAHDITHSRTLAREGDVSIVEVVAPRFGGGTFVFELVHTPPVSVTFSQVGRYGGGVSGRWDLEESVGGRESLLEGRMSARAAFYDLSCSRRMREALTSVLGSLAEHASRLETAPVEESRRRILAVVRKGPSLEVWLDEERFHLVKSSGDGER